MPHTVLRFFDALPIQSTHICKNYHFFNQAHPIFQHAFLRKKIYASNINKAPKTKGFIDLQSKNITLIL